MPLPTPVRRSNPFSPFSKLVVRCNLTFIAVIALCAGLYVVQSNRVATHTLRVGELQRETVALAAQRGALLTESFAAEEPEQLSSFAQRHALVASQMPVHLFESSNVARR
ncbi:MAG: hypothetical protein QY311_00110 [Candidatus Paceibacterota bacterium]|nr:MAG: hypothetical protein QY311_00110 [Candidatus Paceibacterota bacterium]